MPRAARVQDFASHPGIIQGPGVPNVLINGQAAAVEGDLHVCQLPPPSGPHAGTPIIQGSSTVFIGGRSAARQDDTVGCGSVITTGSPNVNIGG